MASLDKRWSDDTGCTRVFIEQVFFFFWGGELVGSKFQKLLMKILKYNEKVAASNLALKTYSRSLLCYPFFISLIPQTMECVSPAGETPSLGRHQRVVNPHNTRATELQNLRKMGGYVTRYVNDFDFVTIRGAGHMVPEYKPEAAFVMTHG